MKLVLLTGFLLCSSVNAEVCDPEGKVASEEIIRNYLAQKIESIYSINFYTDTSMSTEYSSAPKCVSETLYVVKGMDISSGKVTSFLGKLVIDKERNQLLGPFVSQAK